MTRVLLPLVTTALLYSPLAAGAHPMPAPSYCAEWLRQSSEGYERLTLFSDRTVVWKTRDHDAEEIKRKRLDSDEAKFYCDYFGRAEFWSQADDQRSGMTGEFVTQSLLRLARSDGSTKEIWFDELSPLSPTAAALRSSLEGLKRLFTQRVAPASRFTAQTLAPGTVLKRFDGTVFRVVMVNEAKGIVELQGIAEPFSLFHKIDELRYLFQPPAE